MFKALNNATQNIALFSLTIVTFAVEVLDENNEYDPAISTFVSQKKGIYAFDASIGTQPVSVGKAYKVLLAINVNGSTLIFDTESVPAELAFGGDTIHLSTIVQLQAGDRVQVAAASWNVATIQVSKAQTYFSGTRIG